MDIAHILRDILVVLVFAKLAAEVAERLKVPAVVGEILAGIVVGPSVLGWVGGGDEVLRTLGEVGVILLLLDVGLEMDLVELGRVGKASLTVATIGVLTPMLLGMGAMGLLGGDFNTSLFVGAALTATSVGITARVFGDLRALATTEARVVLGAAVADDVMGLVVLTVVVRLVTEGSVSVWSVVGIVLLAVTFLVVGGLVGLTVAPHLFALVERFSRSTGTLVALAFAFALAFAELADAAKLAPIVGAFVAGLALTRAKQRHRIQRELTSVGHLFIPVFFLQIGIDADVGAFAKLSVLRDAAILLAVAVVGKLVAAFGAGSTRADRWLIGLGMLPRGEVGLIFATIGLQNGVLGDDLYASLLLVVLVTTLVTPALLKMRYAARRAGVEITVGDLPLAFEPPRGGWLRIIDGEVRLVALPPPDRMLNVALDAAVEMVDARPSAELLDYLSAPSPAVWDDKASGALRKVVERGDPRSWRFLETVGVLDKALPEVAETLRHRHADPYQVDAASTHRWGMLDRLRSLPAGSQLHAQYERLEHPVWVMFAAFLIEGLEGRAAPDADARAIVRRVGFELQAERAIVGLVADDGLLIGAARRVDALDEEEVLQLASHLDTPERARAAYVLAMLRDEQLDPLERDRLTALHDLVQRVLADPDLTGIDARNLIERRRTEALLLAHGRPGVADRIRQAPRAYLARQLPDTIVRHATLADPPLRRSECRVGVVPGGDDRSWWVDVATMDRPGLMAGVSGALSQLGLDVSRAVVATWDDGVALESFLVTAAEEPDGEELAKWIEQGLDAPVATAPVNGAAVEFDDIASPWHTVCEITAADSPGLLHALTSVFAAAGVSIRAATIASGTGGGTTVLDRFELTGRDGPRLSDGERTRIRTFLAGGVTSTKRRLRRGLVTRPAEPAASASVHASPGSESR